MKRKQLRVKVSNHLGGYKKDLACRLLARIVVEMVKITDVSKAGYDLLLLYRLLHELAVVLCLFLSVA
jgi:hypothetical protein